MVNLVQMQSILSIVIETFFVILFPFDSLAKDLIHCKYLFLKKNRQKNYLIIFKFTQKVTTIVRKVEVFASVTIQNHFQSVAMAFD